MPRRRRKLRTKIGGKLRIEPTGLLPTDPETGLSFTGFTDNWWIGLAMLHTLFTQEHNHVCDLLAHEHRRLERRPAVRAGAADQLGADGEDPHRRVDAGHRAAPDHRSGRMNVIWCGLARRGAPGRARSSSTTRSCIGGIVGSHGGSSQRALFADRGVRRGLPDAPAHSRRGRVPFAGDGRSAREAAAGRDRRAKRRRRSPSA